MEIYNILRSLFLHLAYVSVMRARFFEQLYSPGGCGRLQTRQVSLRHGLVRGRTFITPNGKPFCAFRSIPFAEPPVGALRFMPPALKKPWSGILDAFEESPMCLQSPSLPGLVTGQEDCLYLNVYTPYLKPPNGKLLSVIVWLYGGNYISGNIEFMLYGPQYYMDKDVILVYCNHRGGVFGYLSTGDDKYPGNYGLKDQVAALRWVQDNILEFGGNASSVTLMGMSSGAGAVHYHMLSPLSAGLFNRAIALEGTALNPFSRTLDPLKQAEKQACVLDCPIDSATRLVDCLRETNSWALGASIANLYSWIVFPTAGYTPVVEKMGENNPEPFLPEDPITLIREGRFNRVPFMIGGTSNGGISYGVPVYMLEMLRNQLNSNFDSLLEKLLLLSHSVPEGKQMKMLQIVKERYLGQVEKLDENNTKPFYDLLTDRMFAHGIHKTIDLHVKAGHTDIYQYVFAYKGLWSHSVFAGLINDGVSHGDEAQFVFKTPYPYFSKKHHDLELKDAMTSLIVHFARHGDPTPDITGYGLVDEIFWPTVVDPGSNSSHYRYMDIGQIVISPRHTKYLNQGYGPVKFEVKKDAFKERMIFWDGLDLYENCPANCSRYFT